MNPVDVFFTLFGMAFLLGCCYGGFRVGKMAAEAWIESKKEGR